MTARKPYLTQSCVVLKGGLRFWVGPEQAQAIASEMARQAGTAARRLVTVGTGVIVAASEIVGVFPPEVIEDESRRRAGWWSCPTTGRWHPRDGDCDCMAKVLLPGLGRTEEGPGGEMMTPEEAEAARGSGLTALDALKARSGKSAAEEWTEMMRSREGGGLPPPK